MREVGRADRNGDPVSEAPDEPTESNPQLWRRYLCEIDGRVPRKINNRLHVAWSLIPNPRPGSMGEFLKNLGTAALATRARR